MNRRIALSALFVLCTACYGWRRTDIPEPNAGGAWVVDHPTRVSLRAGTEIRLEHLRIAGDTLIGIDAQNRRVELALGDIRGLRVRSFSTLRTAAAVLAAGTAVFLYVGLRTLSGYGGPTS